MKSYRRVLTIAGSDSGGGAGIQADIKAISAMGCFAASAITAVTVQNTVGVQAVHPMPLDILEGQIDCVLSDIGADAIKIGMLHSAEVVEVVARMLEKYGIRNVVLDPVMVSTSGHRLIEESAIEVITKRLVPLARVITPNIPEAEILSGRKIENEEDFPEVAKMLSFGDKVSVLLKAGHLTGDDLAAYFFADAVASLYSEIMARIRKYPAISYLVISIFPLIPGASIYYTMKFAVQDDMSAFADKGMHTIAIAGVIAVGVLLISTLFRMWTTAKRNRIAKGLRT